VNGVRLLTPGMRRLLIIAGVLVFLAGVQLFVFTERTATYFAWTIEPPLTAAFLGASYWASVALEWRAAGETAWARARIAAPAVFVFTVLTLAATLLHLDRFHLGNSFAPSTRAVTWAWIAVYAFVPPAMVVLMLVQGRATGADPPRRAPLVAWVRAVLGALAALLLVVGAALFLAPERVAGVWPWALTPLTGRAIAAWLVGIGIAAVHGLVENDFRRVAPAALAFLLLGLLQFVALARYPSDIRWGASAWIYVAVLALCTMVGGYGLLRARRAAP
jgi:hypothetical protein